MEPDVWAYTQDVLIRHAEQQFSEVFDGDLERCVRAMVHLLETKRAFVVTVMHEDVLSSLILPAEELYGQYLPVRLMPANDS